MSTIKRTQRNLETKYIFLKRIKLNDQINDNELRKIPKFYLIPGVEILWKHTLPTEFA